MITVITPPSILKNAVVERSVFLAGSIEMGSAENWQETLIEDLEFHIPSDKRITVFNPRRPDWDSSWEQSHDNPQFSQQVNWELDHLSKASVIFMYFDPNTKSPISLLELGLYAHTHKLIVCCPDEFWRQGNVDIVCYRHDIPLFDNLTDAFQHLLTQL